MKHQEITETILGSAMKVHSHFGRGFAEIIYQRSLKIELEEKGFKCGLEVGKNIYYKGVLVGKRRLDLIVNDKVLVELKAISELDWLEYNNVVNYLKVFNIEVGLLLNFGSKSLQFKRFVH